jgi:ABC-type proline/glycine betaine transport system ATPase subunit
LHYLGPNELEDAREVGSKVEQIGRKVVLVPGDISDVETSTLVRCLSRLIVHTMGEMENGGKKLT